MNSSLNITIREAIRTDLLAIVCILADDKLGQTRERCDEPLPETYETAFKETSRSDTNQLLVAIFNDQVVGVLQITFIPYLTFRGCSRAMIEGVCVSAKHRSHGIGKLMTLPWLGQGLMDVTWLSSPPTRLAPKPSVSINHWDLKRRTRA
jgi:ribosomal protein S18 acetylase RimI-like enzyme